MFKNRSLFYLILVGTVFLGTDAILAQTAPNRSFDSDSAQVSFKPPPGEGMPDTTGTAGTRGQCSQDTNSDNPSESSLMMALVPINSYGLTVAARPSFFVYLPKTSARHIILSLQTENKQHHSKTVIPISGEAGIVKIELGKDAPDLEIGTEYIWMVVLVCGEKTTPNAPGIAALIRRIESSKLDNAQIKQKLPIAQAVWYGEQGIWYDTLTALAEAKSAQPDDRAWAKNWENLLQSVGLGAIATEPRRF